MKYEIKYFINLQQQEILNDSSELMNSRRSSKGNVTIPETPDVSDE